MNPASFNSFIALVEEIKYSVNADQNTQRALMEGLCNSANNLIDYLNNGLEWDTQGNS